MFGSKNDKDERKCDKLIDQFGLSDLPEEDKEILEDLFSKGCFVNSAKLLTAFSGGTVQQVTNSLLVDILKTNLMLIRQNDKLIKLLEEKTK